MSDPTELLFSYGTLQYPGVQMEQFGRLLDGERDELAGFRIGQVEISDPEVLRKSGKNMHPVLVACENADHNIAGTAYRITNDELEAADRYEVREYVRRQVRLRSGRAAWVYVAAPDLKVE